MRMLSGRMHWLTVGLALLVSAQEFSTKTLHGQAPQSAAASAARRQAESDSARYAQSMGMPSMMGMPPGGAMPAGGMRMPDGPMSMSFPGPPPMEVVYAGARGCSSGCDSAGGCSSCGGCNACGGGACGGSGCGLLSRLGGTSNCGACSGGGCPACSGMGGGGGMGGMRGCGQCGGAGCGACCGGLAGGIGGGGNGCSLFSGRLLGLLGPLAPYSEGECGSQRWFDAYVGTIALNRTSTVGGFQTGVRDPQTGAFQRTTNVSSDGISGPIVLRSTDLDLDTSEFGLEVILAMQTGPGSGLEARYFGLNNWQTSQTFSTASRGTPDLFSVFSNFGTAPNNGFDDTDRSFIHTVSYDSQINNGEVNYRQRSVSPNNCTQWSWLMGLRYFDLDERFGFAAVGSNNNTFQFDQLRFFNYDTYTRNEMTGFQVGGDLWACLAPGVHLGIETKGGIFGNHSEVEAIAVANSIPGAREFLQDGTTAYLGELTASLVYRLSYSWSIRGAYNLLYVDNVSLAAENMNTRDFSNALGSGNFTQARYPFIDTDGEVVYQGFSLGGEFLY